MEPRATCLSTDTVGAVCLPAEKQHFPRGSQCWVSGWGHTDPSHSESPPRGPGYKGVGVGGASYPKVTHLYLPCPPTRLGQMAVPTPFFSTSLSAPVSPAWVFLGEHPLSFP